MSVQADIVDAKEDAARTGEDIYARLRSMIEPDHNGRVVAIHLPRTISWETLSWKPQIVCERGTRARAGAKSTLEALVSDQ